MTPRFTLLDEAFATPPAAPDPGEDVGSLLGALGVPGATYHSFPPVASPGGSAARDQGAATTASGTETATTANVHTGWSVLAGRAPVRPVDTAAPPPGPERYAPEPPQRGAATTPLSQVFNVLHGRLPPEPTRTRSLRDVFREQTPRDIADRP